MTTKHHERAEKIVNDFISYHIEPLEERLGFELKAKQLQSLYEKFEKEFAAVEAEAFEEAAKICSNFYFRFADSEYKKGVEACADAIANEIRKRAKGE